MCPPGSRRSLAARLGVVLLASLLAAGCVSPERRYQLLSFLFDGVPEPGAVEVAEPAITVARRPEAQRPRGRKPIQVMFRHEPDCDECHSGNSDGNRLTQPRETLCWECHDEDDFEGEFVHGPVASGQCVGCHNPHKSRFASLLLAEGSAICGRCHEKAASPAPGGHRDERGDDCLHCHEPHAAERENMLREGAS